MSGIAGILRRDGRAIPPHWVQWLEESILMRGRDSGGSFQDSVEIVDGTLEIILLHQQRGTSQIKQPIVKSNDDEPSSVRVIDSQDVDAAQSSKGSYAAALWDCETLELHLSRCGSGLHPLYMLDLGEAGNGLVFSSNPSPLVRIADELALLPKDPFIAVQHYLQLGYITGKHTLLSPVTCVPLHTRSCDPQLVDSTPLSSLVDSLHLSPSPAEDLQAVITQLGQPFADASLLFRYWIYKAAKEQTTSLCDDVLELHADTRVRRVVQLARWHRLLAMLPMQTEATNAARDWTDYGVGCVDTVCNKPMIERLTGQPYMQPFRLSSTNSIPEQLAQFDAMHRIPDCIMRGIDACAAAANVEVQVAGRSSQEVKSHMPIPLSKWLRGEQSELGQLAGDIFLTANSFKDIPIDQSVVISMFDAHRNGRTTYGKPLFALLSLGLWLHLRSTP